MKTKIPYLLSNEDIYNWAPNDAVYDRGNDYFFEGYVDKKLTYDPGEHYFLDEDMKLL